MKKILILSVAGILIYRCGTNEFQIPVDETPPEVTITSPSDGEIIKENNVTVSGKVSDTGSGIKDVILLYDGKNVGITPDENGNFSENITFTAEGTFTIVIQATDRYGNIGSSSVTITVDFLPPPTISIDTPICGDNVCNSTEAPGGILTSPITVTTDAEDGRTVTLYSNGIEIGTGIVSSGSATITQSSPLNEGTNILIASVSDLAGNSSTSQSVTVTLDTSLYIYIISPQDGIWINGSHDINPASPGIQISVIASTDAEDGNTVTFRGGDSPVTATVTKGVANAEVTFSSEGTKTLTASVSDNAGNSMESSPIKVYYDNTPPTVTITSPADGQLFKSSCPDGEGPFCRKDKSPSIPLFQTDVNVSVTDNMANLNGATVNVYSNDILVGSGVLSGSGPYTATVQISLREGGNLLTSEVSDTAGNRGISNGVKTYLFVGKPGRIQGTVINMCSGLPISGAKVFLATDGTYSFIITRTTTDLNGNFTLGNVPPGRYLHIMACADNDGNERCEIKNGFGNDEAPGQKNIDDDGVNGVDDCGEYRIDNPYGDDVVVDYIGFYNFSNANGPVTVLPGETADIGTIGAWIGNNPFGFGGECTISGTIADQDNSWGSVKTIIGTMDFMALGDYSPVNVRAYTLIDSGTTQRTFKLYEQPFAPTDYSIFILFAGKDLNGNGKPDINSEPFYILDSASCGDTNLSYTLPPKAIIQGKTYGNYRGWVVTAFKYEETGNWGIGPGLAGSAGSLNPDGTYSLIVFGNSNYMVSASKDRNGYYYDNENELQVLASINPVYAGSGTVGGVDIIIPSIRTISGTVTADGMNYLSVQTEGGGRNRGTWVEPGSNYYLIEVFPGQYNVIAFEDLNANLERDPKEGGQRYQSPLDLLSSDAEGIDITVQPEVRLRNVSIINDTDNDKLPESGETADISLQFRNYGGNAVNVSATLSCISNCDGITINQNTINYSRIDHGELTSPNTYNISIGGGVPKGRKVAFRINISASGGYTNSETFTITIGEGHRNGTPPNVPSSLLPITAWNYPTEIEIISFPSGQTGYVLNRGSGNITVINAVNNTIITTISLYSGSCPEDIASSPDKKRLYITDSCNNYIYVIDPSTNWIKYTFFLDIPPMDIAVSSDGHRLWTSLYGYEVIALDTSTGRIKRIPIPAFFSDVKISPDGKQVFLTSTRGIIVIDEEDQEIQRILNGIDGTKIAIDPFGLYLYTVASNGMIKRIDLDNLTSQDFDFRSIGMDNSGPVAITPDGALLYFTEKLGNDNNVYVFNTDPSSGLSFIGTFTSGVSKDNRDIEFTKEGDKCFVSNASDNTVTPAQ